MTHIRHFLGRRATLIQALTWVVGIGILWIDIMILEFRRVVGKWLPVSVLTVLCLVPISILAYFLGRPHLQLPNNPKLRQSVELSPWSLGFAWLLGITWDQIVLFISRSVPDV